MTVFTYSFSSTWLLCLRLRPICWRQTSIKWPVIPSHKWWKEQAWVFILPWQSPQVFLGKMQPFTLFIGSLIADNRLQCKRFTLYSSCVNISHPPTKTLAIFQYRGLPVTSLWCLCKIFFMQGFYKADTDCRTVCNRTPLGKTQTIVAEKITLISIITLAQPILSVPHT